MKQACRGYQDSNGVKQAKKGARGME